MPDLPAWAVELARQFPVLVIVFVVVWFAVKYLRDQHATHMGQLKERFDEQVKSLQESHRQRVETLTSWVDDLKKERDRLTRELAKREKS